MYVDSDQRRTRDSLILRALLVPIPWYSWWFTPVGNTESTAVTHPRTPGYLPGTPKSLSDHKTAISTPLKPDLARNQPNSLPDKTNCVTDLTFSVINKVNSVTDLTKSAANKIKSVANLT